MCGCKAVGFLECRGVGMLEFRTSSDGIGKATLQQGFNDATKMYGVSLTEVRGWVGGKGTSSVPYNLKERVVWCGWEH